MNDDLHIKGLSELQTFLSQLPAKLEKNIMRGALRAGMKPVKEQAKENIHSVSGLLAEGLTLSTSARAGLVKASLKTSGPHAYVAKFVEFGTAAHWIEATGNLAKAVRLPSGQIFSAVHHPGARPRPFLRPALDAQASAAVIATGDYIKKRLTKEGLDVSDIEVSEEP